MRKVSLQKIEIKEIEVLQDELNIFIVNKSSRMLAVKNTQQYFPELLLMTIAQRMYYSFRKKLEFATKSTATISCEADEAIILMQVCVDAKICSEYKRYVMERIKNLLHKQLINLI